MIVQDFILEEGQYNAEIIAIHEGPMAATKRGPCSTIEIEFELRNVIGPLKRKRQRYLAFASNRSLRQVFKAILGHHPIVLDTQLLIGGKCVVEVRHNRSYSTGKLFANVVNVLPADLAEKGDIKNHNCPAEVSFTASRVEREGEFDEAT